MKLHTVTFSGPDESVSPTEIGAFSNEFPFTEWGLLISPNNQGRVPRYPSANWMRLLPKNASLAFHLCGDASAQFLQGDFSFEQEYPDLAARARRFQLNFSLSTLRDKGVEPNIKRVAELIEDHPTQRFIIQLHGTNGKLLEALLANRVAVDCLLDASCGRGIEAMSWPKPPEGVVRTGFAGGLHPDKLTAQLDRIATTADKSVVNIDFESSLRKPDETHFSIEKCRKIARTVAPLTFKAKTNAEIRLYEGPTTVLLDRTQRRVER